MIRKYAYRQIEFILQLCVTGGLIFVLYSLLVRYEYEYEMDDMRCRQYLLV